MSIYDSNNRAFYLKQISDQAKEKGLSRINQIKKSIDENGFWEDFVEWRISTITESRITTIDRNGKKWFEVKVKCDNEMKCECPTLERAMEFLGIFEQLMVDFFYTVGWSSWASHKSLD